LLIVPIDAYGQSTNGADSNSTGSANRYLDRMERSLFWGTIAGFVGLGTTTRGVPVNTINTVIATTAQPDAPGGAEGAVAISQIRRTLDNEVSRVDSRELASYRQQQPVRIISDPSLPTERRLMPDGTVREYERVRVTVDGREQIMISPNFRVVAPNPDEVSLQVPPPVPEAIESSEIIEFEPITDVRAWQFSERLADLTTGTASHIGGARTTADAAALSQVLAAVPNGPFVTTVERPGTTASGAFTGEEGLNIAGVLRVFAFDSGNLQDGDRVRLTVRDARGIVLEDTITLTFGGRTSTLQARRGLVNVTITALNLGTAPPNTGGLRVSGDVAGSRSGNFNLNVGQSGTIAVRVLGY
jgi:hypothetical protein